MDDQTWDLDRFLAFPRVSDLAVSPDGKRLIFSVAAPAPDGKRFVSSLWEVAADGSSPARRLTRSAPGEGGPVFLPDGSLVFTSTRSDPDAAPAEAKLDDAEVAALWLLPADGGEARLVAFVPAGVDAVVVAEQAGTVVLAAGAYPGSSTPEEDEGRAKARKDAGVTAQLFERYPIRWWDHYVGPREKRLYAADPPAEGSARLGPIRLLTPDPGAALEEGGFDITADGSTVVASWTDWSDLVGRRTDLVAIDTATGEQRPLATAPDTDHEQPACSPDGRWVACIRSSHSRPDRPGVFTLWVLGLDGKGDGGRDLTPELDLWPGHPVWTPDSRAVVFLADERGRRLPFKVALATGTVTRLATEGAYEAIAYGPDGGNLYGLRSSVGSPPELVALDTGAEDQEPRTIPTPGLPFDGPGRVEELTAKADDGTEIHSWLVLPTTASAENPAPLAVFIHGGPLASWSAWQWRWNPHLLAARGWAVVLPNPALSTGYGQRFVERGWGSWGDRPFTDVLAAVDAAEARPDVDASRTAALGGSFGGYMANWVAGHTQRFKAIVTHASLWALDGFHGTTDIGVWWEREFGDPYEDPARYHDHSPSHHVSTIRTPMLVIHGELDHRVPISEGLRLWTDLSRHRVDAKFLYFPDENHWVLKPQNARLWYETVFAFLDHHVLGQEWQRPALL